MKAHERVRPPAQSSQKWHYAVKKAFQGFQHQHATQAPSALCALQAHTQPLPAEHSPADTHSSCTAARLQPYNLAARLRALAWTEAFLFQRMHRCLALYLGETATEAPTGLISRLQSHLHILLTLFLELCGGHDGPKNCGRSQLHAYPSCFTNIAGDLCSSPKLLAKKSSRCRRVTVAHIYAGEPRHLSYDTALARSPAGLRGEFHDLRRTNQSDAYSQMQAPLLLLVDLAAGLKT